jgi:hypothetical protein
MIVDHYTKGVLSIIAASLVLLVIQNATRPAAAALGNVQKVAICDELGMQCAPISFAGYSESGIPGVPAMELYGLRVVTQSP